MPEMLNQLAIDGGRPLRTAPMPGWPQFDENDTQAVSGVLRSGRVNYWTGSEAVEFEREFAAAHGIEHAIAFMNGTVTLEAALSALGVGPDCEVIVPARTFIATASAVVMRGAVPVVVDVDPVSGNITAETIERALTTRTRAVIVVHLAGWPCDMDAILSVTDGVGVPVIEDCAQALGATFRGRPVGTMGAFGSFSFCQDKIMTTGGEGGMLVTARRDWWEKAWSLKDHGKSHATTREAEPGDGVVFRWVHDSFGTNWRMTEMQAVLGRRGMAHLPAWLERRWRSARILDSALAEIPAIRTAVPGEGFGHAYYKYYAYLQPERLREGWSRDRVASAVVAEGVPCFTGTCPEIYRELAFERAGLAPKRRLAVARELGETSLMLLVHPTLADRDIEDAAAAVRKVMAVAAR